MNVNDTEIPKNVLLKFQERVIKSKEGKWDLSAESATPLLLAA